MPRSSSKLPAVVRRLYADREGVVSFEYVIVAALVIAVVAAVFGGARTRHRPGVAIDRHRLARKRDHRRSLKADQGPSGAGEGVGTRTPPWAH